MPLRIQTEKISKNIDEYQKRIGMDDALNIFFKDELNSLYFDFSEHENSALRELLQFAYFHKIYDNLFDIKFIKS